MEPNTSTNPTEPSNSTPTPPSATPAPPPNNPVAGNAPALPPRPEADNSQGQLQRRAPRAGGGAPQASRQSIGYQGGQRSSVQGQPRTDGQNRRPNAVAPGTPGGAGNAGGGPQAGGGRTQGGGQRSGGGGGRGGRRRGGAQVPNHTDLVPALDAMPVNKSAFNGAAGKQQTKVKQPQADRGVANQATREGQLRIIPLGGTAATALARCPPSRCGPRRSPR